MPLLLLAFLLLLSGPAGLESQEPASSRPLRPDTVLAPPGGPRVVLLGTPGRGVAALRLFVPLDEGPLEAGVGRVLQELAADRMAGLARPVGAQVRAVRTPRGLAYEATGAVADLEYLAYLLREAAGRPDVSDVPLSRARSRLASRVARNRETPEDRLATELHDRLEPDLPPLDGTRASLAALDPSRVLEVWQRSHQPEKMTLVASAGVLPEVILAATRGLGTPDRTDPDPPYAPAPRDPPVRETETLRDWYGLGWSGGSGHPPEGPVVALLLADVLAELPPEFESTLRLMELRDHWAFLLLGAAYPARAAAMRSALDGTLDALAASVDAGAVGRASARVRRELLAAARTPMGLVEEVGWRMERHSDPTAASDDLRALQDVDLATVRAFVQELRSTPPVVAEVRP